MAVPTVRGPAFWPMTWYRIVQYRRVWRGGVVSDVLSPLIFLLAMGWGLGSLVDDNQPAALEGITYLAFLAPALAVISAANSGYNQCTYPVLGSVKWMPVAFGQVHSPLRPVDMAVGHLVWTGMRAVIGATVFVTVMVVAGVPDSAWVLAIVPAAWLVAMAFGAPTMAWAMHSDSDTSFASIQRFVIVPMTLFSGTFFPVDQLPAVLRPVAWLTPMWHGVALARSLSLGTATAAGSLLHVAVLATFVVVGGVLAARSYTRRLTP